MPSRSSRSRSRSPRDVRNVTETEPKATEPSSVANEISTDSTQTVKKRKRRFGDESERVFLPHMPSNISATTMTDKEQKIYIRKLFI